jgi:hypothetical protein
VTQVSLSLGLEEQVLRGRREPSPIARELETRTCAGCGQPVLAAHDATAGATVLLDPGPRAYLVIGERDDGRPIVALTSNGYTPHRCPQSHGG